MVGIVPAVSHSVTVLAMLVSPDKIKVSYITRSSEHTVSIPRPFHERTLTAPRTYLDCTRSVP